MESTVSGLKRFYENTDSIQKPTNLNPLIQQVVELTRPRWRDEPMRDGYQVQLELDLVDRARVICDPHEMRTVLTNLIFNALDAMPKGGQINIRLYEQAGQVMLQVKDNGVGMTPEETARCFEPFVSWKEQGSGLGLSICHGIVERHRGTIAVDSKKDVGTTFTLSFPNTADLSDDDSSIYDSIEPHQRVLLIDDDDVVRNSMVAMLEILGADVTAVAEGTDALQRFQEKDFELVITDLGMKGMDGTELIDRIRSTKPDQCVAVVSGWPEDTVVNRFRQQRPPDWILQKPVNVEDLERLFRIRAANPRLSSPS